MYSSPLRHSTRLPKETFACDLHVLATPPAFDLSQDQTLRLNVIPPDRDAEHAGLDPASRALPRIAPRPFTGPTPQSGVVQKKVETGGRVF